MRRGLTREAVLDAAQALADRDGLEALNLTALAQACGVRKPSLYKHVDGLPDVRGSLAARGFLGLAEALETCDDLRDLARSWRAFAVAHPGLYAAAIPAKAARSGAGQEAADAALAALFARLEAAGLRGPERVHAARALRSLVHGFVSLERDGGFGIGIAVEESFDRAVRGLLEGLGLGGGGRSCPGSAGT